MPKGNASGSFARRMPSPSQRLEVFLKAMGGMAAAACLADCSSTSLPSAVERSSVSSGEMAVVLLRVQCAVEDRQSYQPFGFSMVEDNISFGLGSFETGGVPDQIGSLRFLSSESRRDGWTYFVLPHGAHYLVVCPPRRTDVFSYDAMVKKLPRYRLDIPRGSKLVYAGTLRLEGESERLLTGGRIMTGLRSGDARIVNEQALARELAARHLSGLGELQTVLMRRHEGPVVLSYPLP